MADETNISQDDQPLPGPRGQRMMQLGILTKGQKKRPVIPDIRQNAEGKPNPGDVEKAKFAQTLAEKAREQKTAMLRQGPARSVSEANPMMQSFVPRGAPKKPRA